jgi:hypothetical protein
VYFQANDGFVFHENSPEISYQPSAFGKRGQEKNIVLTADG